MKLTCYGHSCFGIELSDGTHLLFDPFITPNELAKGIDIESIPADYLLVTHGHFDHMADAEAILKRTGAKLIANFELVTWFGGKGISNAHSLNAGGAYDFPFGRVKAVNAIHSSVLPDGTYGGGPVGFVVEAGAASFYVSGDTALTLDMKMIGERYALEFAVLCIGDNFTMGAEDAAIAANWVGARTVVGVHYDTFPPIKIDKVAAHSAFTAKGVELLLPGIGETIGI
ncbi:metal-dependent hydrolase [Haloferula sp. BvORR071]|uniref:metal-dependent hydrolase n=1 Tax=Haloferula sp. BvORR071 TaxID=1396141 RepID=UPI00055746F1|nr:metal-dependent hydrolase [Haloferula sp. BvORR071]